MGRRRSRMAHVWAPLLGAGLGLLGVAARGDRLVLTDGTELDGSLEACSADALAFRVTSGELWTFPRNTVRMITFGPGPEAPGTETAGATAGTGPERPEDVWFWEGFEEGVRPDVWQAIGNVTVSGEAHGGQACVAAGGVALRGVFQRELSGCMVDLWVFDPGVETGQLFEVRFCGPVADRVGVGFPDAWPYVSVLLGGGQPQVCVSEWIGAGGLPDLTGEFMGRLQPSGAPGAVGYQTPVPRQAGWHRICCVYSGLRAAEGTLLQFDDQVIGRTAQLPSVARLDLGNLSGTVAEGEPFRVDDIRVTALQAAPLTAPVTEERPGSRPVLPGG